MGPDDGLVPRVADGAMEQHAQAAEEYRAETVPVATFKKHFFILSNLNFRLICSLLSKHQC